ncbi:YfdQ family protein [Oceanimonas sp. NS1]|nr:YfdQ family protein [Oceanimonas sp. NS1]
MANFWNLAANFQVTREAKFQSVKRLHDGTFQFAYSEENTGTGNTTLPETIRLGIAPFHGGEHYAIDVRIRYRLREGQLKLWFEMIELERVLEDAFKGVLAKVQEELPEPGVRRQALTLKARFAGPLSAWARVVAGVFIVLTERLPYPMPTRHKEWPCQQSKPSAPSCGGAAARTVPPQQ